MVLFRNEIVNLGIRPNERIRAVADAFTALNKFIYRILIHRVIDKSPIQVFHGSDAMEQSRVDVNAFFKSRDWLHLHVAIDLPQPQECIESEKYVGA